jgi:hypothetical protein
MPACVFCKTLAGKSAKVGTGTDCTLPAWPLLDCTLPFFWKNIKIKEKPGEKKSFTNAKSKNKHTYKCQKQKVWPASFPIRTDQKNFFLRLSPVNFSMTSALIF